MSAPGAPTPRPATPPQRGADQGDVNLQMGDVGQGTAGAKDPVGLPLLVVPALRGEGAVAVGDVVHVVHGISSGPELRPFDLSHGDKAGPAEIIGEIAVGEAEKGKLYRYRHREGERRGRRVRRPACWPVQRQWEERAGSAAGTATGRTGQADRRGRSVPCPAGPEAKAKTHLPEALPNRFVQADDLRIVLDDFGPGGLQMNAEGGRFCREEQGKGPQRHRKLHPTGGHALEPALQAGDVIAAHRRKSNCGMLFISGGPPYSSLVCVSIWAICGNHWDRSRLPS